MINYYDILGVHSNASQTEIRTAYRKLALKFHPDRNKNSESSTQKFIEIVEAYNVLSNDEARSLYDSNLQLQKPKNFSRKKQPIYTAAEFLNYERLDLGFRIQYPPNWSLDEKNYNPYDDRFTEVVGFLFPSYDEPNQLIERISIEVKYLHSLTIDFDAYNRRQINELVTRYSNAFEFHSHRIVLNFSIV